MRFLSLTLKSMWNRRSTTLLTIFVIALSVVLLLGVERVQSEARSSFANTISGTDLVVGARSGSIQLLLYSVFRIGNATNNISYESYEQIITHPNVNWSVPLSLGDSHEGFRVLGTTKDYFEYYQYGRQRALSFAEGQAFDDLFDAVLGKDVADELGYEIGQEITLAHGTNRVSLLDHNDKPFRVVGILEKTATPVDQTVHVSLEAIEALHIDWQAGVPIPSLAVELEELPNLDLNPKTITAFLVGVSSKTGIFSLQRAINEYNREPLLAVLPGVALQELWSLLSVAERALLIVSGFVVLSGLLGMLSSILSSLSERRREMAILRSVGARPWQIFALLSSEALLFAFIGCLLGICLLYLALFLIRPFIASQFGLLIAISPLSQYDLQLVASVVTVGFLMGLIPAFKAYRNSLADGMTVKV